MSKRWKVLGVIVGVILAIALVIWGVWGWFYGQALPQTSVTLKVEGLSQPVEIVRDTDGVPHIYAYTTADLYFAMGFTHAQERFWQMEFQRRVASGRLSEIFGETTLGTDRYLRQFGFYGSAEQASRSSAR